VELQIRDDDPDWDDIAMLIGSEIVRKVRATVFEKLKYTSSAGVAQNKMLAKLGSAHKKPNQQTVIRNRAVQQFMSDFKFTKIRNLGGKLGDQIVATFNTDTVKDLLDIPIERLKQKLDEETGTWVYQVIRGGDFSEVSSRTQIKSMLSAKSFRPSINTPEQAIRWLRIFAADIYSRLVEEGVLENKRRPKSINLHHRQGGQTRSRQAPIPQGKTIDEVTLFSLAKNLLDQIILEGRVWPCANLSLSVGGFEDRIAGNMEIGAFLVRGDQAKAINCSKREPGMEAIDHERSGKRRRLSDVGIQKFFDKANDRDEHDADLGAQPRLDLDTTLSDGDIGMKEYGKAEATALGFQTDVARDQETINSSSDSPVMRQCHITDYICSRCNLSLGSANYLQSHMDWHFAKDLQDGEREQPTSAPKLSKESGKQSTQHTSKRKSGGRSKPEKGQSKLAFG